jgi:hypothetical protein
MESEIGGPRPPRASSGSSLLLAICLIAAGNPVGLSAQDDVFAPEHPWLTLRYRSAPVGPGSHTLTANCLEHELLLGGGYRTSPPALDAPFYPSFEASYPSGPRSWSVVVFARESAGDPPVVVVEAYCLTRPIARVSIVESAAGTAVARADGFYTSTHTASCPDGSVLTSGGFRTTHTMPNAGIHNAWITGSNPTGSGGRAASWRVAVDAIQWPPPPGPPLTRAYAVCASPAPLVEGAPTPFPRVRGPGARAPASGLAGRITAGTLVAVTAPNVTEFGYTYQAGIAVCPAGELTVGGGHTFDGDRLIPHHIHRTSVGEDVPGGVQAAPARRSVLRRPAMDARRLPRAGAHAEPFRAWRIGSIYGFQRGQENSVVAYVACIRFPEVHLTVRIVSPMEGASARLEFEPGGGAARTVPIGFRAIAGDGSGQYVAEADFVWTLDGAPLGSGEHFTATLAAERCSLETRTIEVTASRGGHTATDQVRIRVGNIC